MSTKKPSPQYTAEFRARGVRLFREQRADHASEFKQVRAADRTVRGTVRMRRTQPTVRSPRSLVALTRRHERGATRRPVMPVSAMV